MKWLGNIILLLIVGFMFSCSDSSETNPIDNPYSIELEGADLSSFPADNISVIGQHTRSLWSFNSENLSVNRVYEDGDVLYVLNPYLPKLLWTTFPYPAYNYNRTYYNTSKNAFSVATQKGGVFFQKTYVPPSKLSDQMANNDSLMIAILDKNYNGWDYDAAQDTSMILPLTNQIGTQNDAFAHQMIYLTIPRSMYAGTHLWTQVLMAYYWLEFTFPNQDVASIDTIRVHADEPMPSKVAWKYRGYLSKNYTEYKGPYAIGTNSFSSKKADAFIAFYVGEGTTTFNNFGFDISYTLTDGTKHKGSSNVRPQVKTASPGNLYRNAFLISKAHGVQNTYVDEKVEVDNWSKAYDQSVIAPKSGVDLDAEVDTSDVQ